MGDSGDVIAELTSDHREVEELFSQFEGTPPDSEERKRLADEITIELVRHAVAEEEHLYPAVREHLEGGGALADQEIAGHERVEQLLKELEGRESGDLEFNRLMVKLRTEVTAHVRDEENDLFPRLREGVHSFILESLGRKVREAKKSAPTRPRPSAPSTPPAIKLLAPGLGLVDRTRDFLTGRGQGRP
ncbi:hemerythrin domain-containing protein [Streptomyces sp. BHT-5-2]|uniref:hemerythrin domain-containing protein n=1 Tax=Streptomyces sp. BHT-5-2 TaxID=2866715 RepID=UPI001C8DBAE3|nr:hemerythrin domain-containing protein [Streptomyces sp. BHT-5-2]QZL04573.1 hemerythrin domain-containing protein [Streptomyces sp. BHT-5-2]